MTALASFPGSGNTWARFLVQQVTGYATGAVYNDQKLHHSDFPGEGIFDGRVIAIKTHCHRLDPPHTEWPSKFDQVLLLIRDPFDALIAEFNRRQSESHVGHASLEAFTSKNWFHYVENSSKEWFQFYKFYIETYEPSQIHVIKFENLKSNLVQEMKKLVAFLKLPWSIQDQCLLNKQQGSNQRTKANIDLKQFFTPQQKELIMKLRNETYTAIDSLNEAAS